MTHTFAVDWKYKGYTYDFGLFCDREGTRENYLSMTEFIPALVGLLASVLSDTYGRLMTFKVSSVICLTLAVIGAALPYEIVKILSLSFFIGEEAVLCTLFTYIINETCTTKSTLRSKAVAFYFAIFAMGGVLIS